MALPSNSCKNLINPVHAQNCKKKSGEMRNSHHPFFFVDSGESTSLSEFLILGNFRTHTHTHRRCKKPSYLYKDYFFRPYVRYDKDTWLRTNSSSEHMINYHKSFDPLHQLLKKYITYN